MDRRTFLLGTTAAALYASRPAAWQAAAVELGSIDGSVGGNNFTPAQFLGLEHERGVLVPGARADLVALTEDLRVVATWVDGARDAVANGAAAPCASLRRQ